MSLPNSTAVLVLGILSIVTCCCWGVIGLILSIIALVLSKRDRILYTTYSGAYTESSFKNLNAGRVCAIIGLVLSAVGLVNVLWQIIFGRGAMSELDMIREALQNLK